MVCYDLTPHNSQGHIEVWFGSLELNASATARVTSRRRNDDDDDDDDDGDDDGDDISVSLEETTDLWQDISHDFKTTVYHCLSMS